MDEQDFWALVDLLDGVADDTTTPRLDAVLRESGRAEDFLANLADRVERLLDRCEVPVSHHGETAGWIAAAVVAAGRETYEQTLAAGAELDPDVWAWSEAENLLVAGVSPQEVADVDLHDRLTLQWRTTTVPAGVVTHFEPDLDLGDDPGWGQSFLEDQQWDHALEILTGDELFAARLGALGDIMLHVVVRDTDEAVVSLWPRPEELEEDEELEDAVLVVPTGTILAAASRTEAYVQAVQNLISSVPGR